MTRVRRSRKLFVAVLLMALSACVGPREDSLLDCRFIPVRSVEDEVAGCAYADRAGGLVLLPKMIAALKERDPGPVPAVVGSTLHYLNRAGRSAPVLWHDNGADYFVEGLARTIRNGKVGFIDRELTERIAPTWDFAFPFAGGFARVCQGCRAVSSGEHTAVQGGLWGYIDRQGEVVVPVAFDREQLRPPSAR